MNYFSSHLLTVLILAASNFRPNAQVSPSNHPTAHLPSFSNNKLGNYGRGHAILSFWIRSTLSYCAVGIVFCHVWTAKIAQCCLFYGNSNSNFYPFGVVFYFSVNIIALFWNVTFVLLASLPSHRFGCSMFNWAGYGKHLWAIAEMKHFQLGTIWRTSLGHCDRMCSLVQPINRFPTA